MAPGLGVPATFAVRETRLGWLGIIIAGGKLRATTTPYAMRDAALRAAVEQGAVEPAGPEAEAIVRLVLDCAEGRAVDLSADIDWNGADGFRRAVLEEAMRIPAGQTRSYLWLAERVGRPRAARAVGRVMATNPLPVVVPCHRVIGSDGTLHGYGGEGGIALKARLLATERARVG